MGTLQTTRLMLQRPRRDIVVAHTDTEESRARGKLVVTT